MAAREVADYVATGTGLCLECSGDFAPGLLVVQIILFLIGTGLAMFDTYTDWEVVLDFKEVGFNNPLLPHNDNWLRAWFLFAAIGTFLTLLTVLHDGVDLLYSAWQTCRKRCCKSKSTGRYAATDQLAKEKEIEMSEIGSSDPGESKMGEDEDEIDDPLKCCYRCGCNPTTRAETLAFITLWFQDVPMMTLAVLYAFSQSTCKVPDHRDVTGVLRDIGISAVAATAAVAYRLLRSTVRLCMTLGVRAKSKDTGKSGKCATCCSRCLPKPGDVIYPPDTCSQCCIFPYVMSLVFDYFAIVAGAAISVSIWYNYVQLRTPNFDDSLAIYRFPENVHLINISNNIIPPKENRSYLSLESISDSGTVIHCLSEFQYIEEDSEIYFNTIELEVVSPTGKFCANKTTDRDSNCVGWYTYMNAALFYGFLDPNDGTVERFDDECIVIRDIYPKVFAGPKVNSSIQVDRNINTTTFPRSNEELRIFYRSGLSLNVSRFINELFGVTFFHTFQDPSTGEDIDCGIRFQYDHNEARVIYNARQVLNFPPPPGQTCTCAPFLQRDACYQFHQVLVYGYYPNDDLSRDAVVLAECSELPLRMLLPYFDRLLSVDCSRINCEN